MDSVWVQVQSCGFEHRDMEDRVDCMHAVWKSSSVRVGANSSNNLERAKILLSKLLGGSSGLEELHFYKYMRSCFKFQSVVPT